MAGTVPAIIIFLYMMAAGFSSGLFFCRLDSASRSRFRKELCSFDAPGVVRPILPYKNNRGKQRLLIPSFKDLTILTVIFTFRLRSK
jgi:hypothetical protein